MGEARSRKDLEMRSYLGCGIVAALSLFTGCSDHGGIHRSDSAPDSGGAAAHGSSGHQSPTTTPPESSQGPGDVIEGELWSDPATWGGTLPDPTQDLTIPAGKKVVLDQNACVRGLTLEGELGFADRDLELCADWIMIHGMGRLSIGSEARPFTQRATITLKGALGSNQEVMGTKFIGAMSGGRLDLHGQTGFTAWTRLAGPVEAGATTLEVEDATGWQPGDSIVIAADGLEPDEAEVHDVTAVSGNVLTLAQGVKVARTGTLGMIQGRSVDTRAEVARLNRNVVIQGDAESEAGQFGGHIMIMVGGEAYVDGIELRRMGQFDTLARYPFHWHLVGQAPGQYIKNSVVNVSYQRGIVVHATQHTLVENNIVFDSQGHNFIIETPDTIDNTFKHNLAVKNRLGIFTADTLKTQNDNEVANFWIRAARNTLTGNAAAGSTATGFWYDATTDGPTVFENNVGHSAASRGTGADFVRESGLLAQPAEAEVGDSPVLEFASSTFFENAINLWPSEVTQRHRDLILVGAAGPSVTAEAVDQVVTISDTLFVANTPGKPARATSSAILVQYGAAVRLENPVFVGFEGGVLSDNDIAQPFMSDITISNAQLLEGSIAALPERSIAEMKDGAFLPPGYYVPADAPDMAGPNMQLITLQYLGEPYQVYFGPQRECPAAMPNCAWGPR
jgi:hypothetical protein